MKRIGNLYQQICSLDNLRLAEAKARRGKAWQYGVQVYDRNAEANLLALQQMLMAMIKQVPEEKYPFTTTIQIIDDRPQFT